MTNEEAHYVLEDLQRLLTNYRHISPELTEANGIAIEALEKRMPKIPYRIYNVPFANFCSSCDNQCGWVDGVEDVKPEYCSHCGQAIDWSGYDK